MAPQAPAPQRKRGHGDADGRPRKRGKVTRDAVGPSLGTEAPPQPQDRRGRPSLQRGREQQHAPDAADEAAEGAADTAPHRRRGRPSLRRSQEEDGESRQQDEPKPRKRGRPSLPRSPPSRARKQQAKARQGVKRREEAGDQSRSQREDDEPCRDASPVRRHDIARPDRQNPISLPAAPPSPPKPYVHVVPQIRRVRQSTIKAKWSPLTGPSLAAVSALLHLAHRPILQQLSGTHQRRVHAAAVLRLVARRIARKVARGLPFPPAAMPAPARGPQPTDGGRETELDFESVLDAVAALEAQLEPAAHAVELLRREKARVERELERDYEALSRLETGARAHAREQRALLKKAHALAPAPQQRETPEVEPLFMPHGGGHESTAPESLFADLDEELRPLAAQLAGHVRSIRSNAQQAEGVVPQLARSRAALQAVLLRHLGQSQHEHVVLG